MSILILPSEMKGGKPVSGWRTRFVAPSGDEVPGISRAVITIAPDALITAEITVEASVEEVWAQPFMSEASFLAAADRYGYDVDKRED